MASLLWLIAACMDLAGSGGQKGGLKRGVITALAQSHVCFSHRIPFLCLSLKALNFIFVKLSKTDDARYSLNGGGSV